MLPNKSEKSGLLCFGERISKLGVVRQYISKCKLERVFPDQIIIYCHLEGWTQNRMIDADRVLLQTGVVQLHVESLGVQLFHGADFPGTEGVVFDSIDCSLVGADRVRTQFALQAHIQIHKLGNRDVAALNVDPV